MADWLIIFEDDKYPEFYPLALSRPVFSLRCGMMALWEKITRRFPGYTPVFSCREEVAGVFRSQSGQVVNRCDYRHGDRLVFVNGRLRLGDKLAKELKNVSGNRIYLQGGVTAAIVVVEPLEHVPLAPQQLTAGALGVKADLIEGEFEFYDYLWDCVHRNGDEICLDFLQMGDTLDVSRMLSQARVDSSARILSDNNFYLAPGAEINAGAVIDNRNGPVIVDTNAVVGPLSFVEGPCYIGPETQVFRGNIRRGCSFGPVCRVGGEIEESIFQGYTNKYHDGFLGHAYVGSWVNLGAMTTNSDLKNNYGNIAVVVNGRKIQSGMMKVGCFIGDHTKTGIGTLLNTGVSIGFSCNIYGGTLVTSAEVPSFSWGDERGYDIYRLDKAMDVARASMSRRNVPFTADDERMFRIIFEQTAAER
jgi:UDP-N-acetylglucosamine diphosphorylase/glucosamine-1-phosphate N-acetyltransferase